MSYVDQKLPHKMLGVVLLVFVAGMAIRYMMAGGFIEYYVPEKRVENQIVAELEQQPGGKALLDRLEESFPKQREDLLETLTRAATSDGPTDRVVQAANGWIARFFAGYKRDFNAAPLANLDAVIALEDEFLTTLQSDHPEACTDYAFGVARQPDLPGDVVALGSRIMDARFAAISAGRSDQQLRLGLTPPDLEALDTSLREAGMSDLQRGFLRGANDGLDLSDSEACNAAVALVQAIRAQPDDRRALMIGAYVSGT